LPKICGPLRSFDHFVGHLPKVCGRLRNAQHRGTSRGFALITNSDNVASVSAANYCAHGAAVIVLICTAGRLCSCPSGVRVTPFALPPLPVTNATKQNGNMITVASYRVLGFGDVNVVEQNGAGDRFWDLFASSGECLNEGNPFWRKPTRREVEEYLSRQLKEVLSRLEKECERNRIGQEELDEAVHEAAQRNNARLNQAAEGRQERLISAAEEKSVRINNEGRPRQLAYLFEVYGEAGTLEALKKARG
jgi:hypothetical protein